MAAPLTKSRAWTLEEIANLKSLYEIDGLGKNEIASLLKRSPTSVWIKIKRMRFRHNTVQTAKLKSRNVSGERNAMYGTLSWSHGLTKETDARLERAGKKNSETRKRLYREGRINNSGKNNGMYGKPSWCRGLTAATCPGLQSTNKKNSEHMKNKWAKMTEEDKGIRREHMVKMCHKMLHNRGDTPHP